jgi:hypothetical protein
LGDLRFSGMGRTIILYQAAAEKLPESLTYIAAGPNHPWRTGGVQRDGVNQAGEYKIMTFRVHQNFPPELSERFQTDNDGNTLVHFCPFCLDSFPMIRRTSRSTARGA